MAENSLINRLIEALRCLPGVGPKSAQRMTYYLLERNRDGARRLAKALDEAMNGVGHCSLCRTLSEDEICTLCASKSRDHSQLCIVEMPADVQAVEHSTSYKGLYFVLMGHLSPLDGIGPESTSLTCHFVSATCFSKAVSLEKEFVTKRVCYKVTMSINQDAGYCG